MASWVLTLLTIMVVVVAMVFWMRAQQRRMIRSFRLRADLHRDQQQDLTDLGYTDRDDADGEAGWGLTEDEIDSAEKADLDWDDEGGDDEPLSSETLDDDEAEFEAEPDTDDLDEDNYEASDKDALQEDYVQDDEVDEGVAWGDVSVEENEVVEALEPEAEDAVEEEAMVYYDILFAINMPGGWGMRRCVEVLEQLGFDMTKDGIMNVIDQEGRVLFCAACACEPGYLDQNSDQTIPGIVFLCKDKREREASSTHMLMVARAFRQQMGGELLDAEKTPIV